MTQLPKVGATDFQGREGVLIVGLKLNKLGLIFRETPNFDVGIDGQIEYVINNVAIGKVVAVQIKSGKSYMKDKGEHFAYYPEEKHKSYWESFPLPVILMLHDPETDNVYFTDARYYLSIPKRERCYSYIPVLKSSILNNENKDILFNFVGAAEDEFFDMPQLLEFIVNKKNANAAFPLSFFDLFVNGLTNLCRHLFFSMGIASDIAEFNLVNSSSNFGMGVGSGEHEFLHNYVRFLIAQNLVKVDYSDYLLDWNERMMQPMFLAPLTTRGRDLVDYIREKEKDLFAENENKITVACERFIEMFFAPSDKYRLNKIKEFSNRYNAS